VLPGGCQEDQGVARKIRGLPGGSAGCQVDKEGGKELAKVTKGLAVLTGLTGGCQWHLRGLPGVARVTRGLSGVARVTRGLPTCQWVNINESLSHR